MKSKESNKELIKEVVLSPYKFKVFFKDSVKIDENQEGLEVYGYIDFDNEKIYIQEGMASTITKATLVHEIIHGILYRAGFINHNEHYVDAISKGLMDLIHSNPSIIDYLREQ